MTLIATKHETRSKAIHLRVQQSLYSEAMKHRLQRVGSPARWLQDKGSWDYPLSPAAVIALDRVAKESGEQIEWRDGLWDYAEQHLKQSDHEHQTRLAIENIIRTKPPLPEYVTRRFREDGTTVDPLYHQQVFYHWSQRVGGLLAAHDPGCISGDATIKVSRAGKTFACTLRDLYAKFNAITGTPHPWRDGVDTRTKSLFPDGILRHQKILQVLARGRKKVVRVRLSSGKDLVCTADHEIAVDGGWRRADGLAAGTGVLTNGTPVCAECGSTDRIITYAQAKYRGLCIRCAHRGGRNGRWIDGRRKDKDGYVLVSNQYAHPNRDRHNNVREHVLVVEKHLKRYLGHDEVVHHKNGIKDDNRLCNLEVALDSAHKQGHGRAGGFAHLDGGRAGTGGEIIFLPRRDTVVDVVPAGEIDVYDLVMPDPARNFVANGVIVHNCGKTRSASDASGGWYRNQLIRPMTPAIFDNTPGVEGGVLVVCPKTVMKTWERELALWQNASSVLIRGDAVRKRRLAATPSHYHIVNYESLNKVAHNKYDGLIIDECHRCANNTTQTHHTLSLSQRARKRIGLSGTPIANSLESIFYPLLILDGGKALGASKTAFLEKFFTLESRGQFSKHIPKQEAAEAIAQAMAASTHFVTKEEVLPFLPKKTHTPLYLEMTPEQERYYNTVKREAVAYIQDSEVTVEQASARMMKLLQICQGFVLPDDGEGRHFNNVKTDALFDLLTDTLVNRKVIVWCYFKYEIARVVEGLRQRGIKAVHVDGDVTSQRRRDADADAWNRDPSVKVYVRQLGMSEGVTLIGNESGLPCYDNIYCGLSYKYIEWKQSQDRIHRIGQEQPCAYTYLLTENGVDRSVYDNVLQKNQVAGFVHDHGKDYYLSLLKQAV